MRARAALAMVLLCTACAHHADVVEVDRFPASLPLGTVSVAVTPTKPPPSISAPTRLRAAGTTALESAVTMGYSHLAPDHLRAAVAVLDDVLPALKFTESTAISAQASAQASAQELVPAGEVSREPS